MSLTPAISRLTTSQYKARLITKINEVITGNGKDQLTTTDFDILYELTIEELMDTENEIVKHFSKLKTIE